MSHLADIEVYDKTGRPSVLVEVKSKLGTTPDWAAAMRRNLAAHGVFPPARFFLLAMPDRFYFWIDRTSDLAAIPPDFELEPTSIFEPYLARAGLRSHGVSETSLELMVASWLSELTHGGGEARIPAEGAAWLRRSGFFDAVRGGRLEHQ